MDTEVMYQAIEKNPVSSTQNQANSASHSPIRFITFILGKNIWSSQTVPHVTIYCQTFDSP